MPLPTLPSTHRWVDGGLVATISGRALITPGPGIAMVCWDADTDERVTDLYDADGIAASEIQLVAGTFRAGVPKSVTKPMFSVGVGGLRFSGNDWGATAGGTPGDVDGGAL
jgi:hypothetical protein